MHKARRELGTRQEFGAYREVIPVPREGYPIVHIRGFSTLFLFPFLAKSIDSNHTCSSRVILATLLQVQRPGPVQIEAI